MRLVSVQSPRRFGTVVLASITAAALAWPSLALAQQPPQRLSDKEVKTLIEQLDTARDKFEGNLDNAVKNGTIRTATREISVSASLQDLQDNTQKLKDRFTDDYAASAEAETVLRQGSNIATYMRTATLTKGRSEWDKLAATMTGLAGAYRTTFPVPEGATVRRINDKELADAADGLLGAVDQYKSQINDDPNLSKADKDAGKNAADALTKATKALKSRVSDGKPATAEARQVAQLVTSLAAFNGSHMVPTAQASYGTVMSSLDKVQQGFGLTQTPPR